MDVLAKAGKLGSCVNKRCSFAVNANSLFAATRVAQDLVVDGTGGR